MRIAWIVPGFSARESDSCIPVLEDLARLMGRRLEIEIFALHYPFTPGRYRVFGVEVEARAGANRSGLHRIPRMAGAFRSLIRHHRQRPFQLIHGFFADEPGALAVAAGKLLGVPSVVSIMGGEAIALPTLGYGGALSRVNRRLLKFSLRGADKLTAGSYKAGETAQQFTPRRVAIVPLGVDRTLFSPAQEDRLPAGLLHVGSLTPVKDQGTLLETFARVSKEREDATLDIIGDGPLRGQLQEQAARLGLLDRIRFRGRLARSELAGWYRRAALVLITSVFESQSLVALEAAACRTAIAGTAVGLLPELLPSEGCVDPGDPAALAARVNRLLASADQRASLAERLHEKVIGRYCLEGTVDAFYGLYRLLKGGSLPKNRSHGGGGKGEAFPV